VSAVLRGSDDGGWWVPRCVFHRTADDGVSECVQGNLGSARVGQDWDSACDAAKDSALCVRERR
jgi:hypothetical protein